ncbi:MAG: NAD(+) diphosphatase [Oscillospiraceae bacterium]
MTFEYCPKCGSRLIPKPIDDEGEIPFCESCDRPWFSFSYPCVICLLTDGKDNYALIRQSYGTTDRYVCVAGFMKTGECAEETAVREIKEETGLDVKRLQYINSYYYAKNDNLMLGFVATVERAEFHLSDEVKTARWFTRAEAISTANPGSIVEKLMRDYFALL